MADTEKELTNKQKAVAEYLVANPEMSYEDVADKLEINRATIWRWRKLPKFKDYMHELCMERFKDLEKLAVLKLQQNITKNNQKAIEYALNFAGYQGVQKIDADMTAKIEIDYGE